MKAFIFSFLYLTLFFICAESYFDCQLDRFEVCSQNKEFTDWSDLKVKKLNKTTRALVGEIKFFQPFDNNIIIEVKAYKKQGNLIYDDEFELFIYVYLLKILKLF
jgi:hypothetical protein